jgi:hypothetical protein
MHKPCTAGDRDRLVIVRDDRQEDASCAKLEQPARKEDHRSSRGAASSRSWCERVAELRYVSFRPVVDATLAGQFARRRRDRLVKRDGKSRIGL